MCVCACRYVSECLKLAFALCVTEFRRAKRFSGCLFLMSRLIELWSENTLCVVSVLLDLLRFISWPRVWSVLINVHGHLETKVCPAAG